MTADMLPPVPLLQPWTPIELDGEGYIWYPEYPEEDDDEEDEWLVD